MPGTLRRKITGTVICMGATGKYVNPLDLKPSDINLEDIILHLSHQCRYSGAIWLSVAEHSVRCAWLAHDMGLPPIIQKTALLHDAAEAYLQDVSRPLKEDPYFGKAYRGAEKRAEKVICEVFEIPYPFPGVIKEIDTMMLKRERTDLMPPDGDWEVLHGVTLPEPPITETWPSRAARTRFRATWDDIDKELGNG